MQSDIFCVLGSEQQDIAKNAYDSLSLIWLQEKVMSLHSLIQSHAWLN